MVGLAKSVTLTIIFLVNFTAGDYCSTLHSDLLRRQLESWSPDGPFEEDIGTEKHVPYVSVTEDGNIASNGIGTVLVGNGNEEGGVFHPMTASDDPGTVHFINHIYVVDQYDSIFAMKVMDPLEGVPATMNFEIPSGVTSITPYEFCNLHGLWRGPTVNLTNTSVTSPRSNTLTCDMNDDISNASAYSSFHADFVRRQSLPPFAQSNPYTEDGKHAPHITLNGSNGTVVVGVEGNMHVMDAGDDENEPHWITEIYVVDQDGNIIAYESLDPSNVDIATMNFAVPESATELTAYEWCNIHGLWQGPTVQVQQQNGENATVQEPQQNDEEQGQDHDGLASSSHIIKSDLWLSATVSAIFVIWVGLA